MHALLPAHGASRGDKDENDDRKQTVFYTDFPAFAVSAKDVVTKTVNVTESYLYESMQITSKKKGWYRFPIAKEFVDKEDFQIVICMTVIFPSYENAVESKTVKLYNYKVPKDQLVVEGNGGAMSSMGIMTKPYVLLSHTDSFWKMIFSPR